ncbi:MAG: Sll0314/Alr1548 family TPR repeat-containing protein [Elainellaceae cyanobacterium]
MLSQRTSLSTTRSIWRTLSLATGLVATGTVAAMSLWMPSAKADPFRPNASRITDPQVEQAFNAMFQQSQYNQSNALLNSASANEPLTHAMQASFAYWDEDWGTLASEAEQTLAAAQSLVDSGQDPLRGHLYLAVGHFMEGAHAFLTQGTVQATPIVLSKVRQVFDNLDKAQEIDPNDPEVNLVKGYMDLMLAVNLPFSSPEAAIARFQSQAGPDYLVNRGLAIAYRDLRQVGNALTAVNQALEVTPDNPDLLYLKAQILRLQADDNSGDERTSTLRESVSLFNQALGNADQYPRDLSEAIAYEMCRTQDEMNDRNRNCDRIANDRVDAELAAN